MLSDLSSRVDLPADVPFRRIVLAGVCGSAAYLLEMWLDERLFRVPTDDLVLLGGLLSPDKLKARLFGAAIHAVNGILVASVYARFVRDRLPGSPWARGVALAVSENTFLWPLILVLDRVHPDIKSGALPSYNRGAPWLQAVLRHVAFGATMGAVVGSSPSLNTPRSAASTSAPMPES